MAPLVTLLHEQICAASGVAVIVELLVSQFEHVADHGDAASFDVGLRHQFDRPAEGVGIGVVGVVVDGGAAPGHDHAAVIRRLDVFDTALDAFP
mgnify:CR=1 FL=1